MSYTASSNDRLLHPVCLILALFRRALQCLEVAAHADPGQTLTEFVRIKVSAQLCLALASASYTQAQHKSAGLRCAGVMPCEVLRSTRTSRFPARYDAEEGKVLSFSVVYTGAPRGRRRDRCRTRHRAPHDVRGLRPERPSGEMRPLSIICIPCGPCSPLSSRRRTLRQVCDRHRQLR